VISESGDRLLIGDWLLVIGDWRLLIQLNDPMTQWLNDSMTQ
jgi:hypothetical protein